MFKILAFDSSTTSTGYSVYVGGEFQSYGVLECEDKIMRTRVQDMIRKIYQLIAIEKPNMIIFETTFANRNIEAQKNLTYILGAIIGKCTELKIPYDSFIPSEWRNLVKDKDEKLPRKREELKQWSLDKVFSLYGKEFECDDITDAILIGRAYCNRWM